VHRAPVHDRLVPGPLNATPETAAAALARKLGLRPGIRLALVGAPAGWPGPGLPDGVAVHRRSGPANDVTVAFFGGRARMARALPGLAARLRPDAALWVAWPRRAGVTSATWVTRPSGPPPCPSVWWT
jgi:hypothetical protein